MIIAVVPNYVARLVMYRASVAKSKHWSKMSEIRVLLTVCGKFFIGDKFLDFQFCDKFYFLFYNLDNTSTQLSTYIFN